MPPVHRPESPRWTRRSAPPVLGVVMIVKDEEANLPQLFATIAELADEVVVVDTGSTDRTREICREWGVTLHESPWTDDFAHARNQSIRFASASYLLWLDGDDRLPAASAAELARMRDEVLPSGPPRAYAFEVQNADASGGVADVFLSTRLFPRLPGVAFRNAIHEQLTESLQESGVPVERSGLAVLHTGYASPAEVRRKALRNERLLLRALDERPGNLPLRVYLAQTLRELGRAGEAVEHLSAAISQLDDDAQNPRLVASLLVLRANLRLSLSDRAGTEGDLRAAIRAWPAWGIPKVALAALLMDAGRWDEARKALESADGASYEPGVIGLPLRAYQHSREVLAAKVLQRRGDVAGSIECLDRALALEPRDAGTRLELGRALVDQGEYFRAREVLEAGEVGGGEPQVVVCWASALGLACALSGDAASAGAYLSPLLDLFADRLGGADDVDPLQLAEVMLQAGFGDAAEYMIRLHQAMVTAV